MNERLGVYLLRLKEEGELLRDASLSRDWVECRIRFTVIRLLVDLC